MTDDKAAPITEGQTPRTDASTNLWLLARQLELELAACEAATRERCAKKLDNAAIIYRGVPPALNAYAVIRAEECEQQAVNIRALSPAPVDTAPPNLTEKGD